MITFYFQTDIVFRACMDTTETGELEKCDLMASFYEERKFSKISKSGVFRLEYDNFITNALLIQTK